MDKKNERGMALEDFEKRKEEETWRIKLRRGTASLKRSLPFALGRPGDLGKQKDMGRVTTWQKRGPHEDLQESALDRGKWSQAQEQCFKSLHVVPNQPFRTENEAQYHGLDMALLLGQASGHRLCVSRIDQPTVSRCGLLGHFVRRSFPKTL
jgi:hypothetical protein